MFRSTASGSAGWVGSRILAQGLEFGAWVLLARELGASAVGVLAVAAILGRLLGLIGDWGAAFRGPRDVVLAGRESALVAGLVRRRELVSAGLAISMAFGLVVAGWPELLPIAIVVVARGAGRDWIALGEGRRFHSALPLLVQGGVICGVVALTSSLGAAAMAIGGGNLLGLLVSVRLNPVAVRRSIDRVVIDGWYLMASIADQILVSADTVMLIVLRSSAEAGIYTSIYRLPLAWVTVIGLVTTAIIPIVTRAANEGHIKPLALHRIADRVGLVGAVLILPAAILGLVLVGPVFGDDFTTGHDALLILFVATAATTASAPFRVLYTAFGPDRLVGLVTGLVAAGNLVGNLAVVPYFGMQGAAMTTLISQVAMLCFFVGWSRKNRREMVDHPGPRATERIEPA